MHSIAKNWHEFRVHLSSLNDWLLANAGEGYKGMSADSKITFWFEEEPTAEVVIAIDAYWDSLTEEGEAAKFALDAEREAAVLEARDALLTADLTTLTVAERKLFMNMPITDEDRDALLAKYPQGE